MLEQSHLTPCKAFPWHVPYVPWLADRGKLKLDVAPSIRVEHDVKLTHVLEVLVQSLHKGVDELQNGKFIAIFIIVYADDEVQGSISPVDDAIVPVFYKGALAFTSRQAFANQLALQSDAFANAQKLVVLSQSGLALLVHHQNEFDHRATPGRAETDDPGALRAGNSKLFGQPAGELQAQTFSLVACLVRTFSPKQTERKPIPPGLGMRSELG